MPLKERLKAIHKLEDEEEASEEEVEIGARGRVGEALRKRELCGIAKCKGKPWRSAASGNGREVICGGSTLLGKRLWCYRSLLFISTVCVRGGNCSVAWWMLW